MNSERDSLESLANVIGIGQRFEEIAADLIEHVEIAPISCIDHLYGVESRPCRNVKSPELAKGRCAVGANGNSAWKEIWGSADFGATLHAGVASDGHQSAFFTPDESAGQREIDDGFDVGGPVAVLGDAH